MVKDGYKFAAGPLLVGIVAVVFHWNWLGGVLIFLGLFVMFFFRDPERTPPPDPDTIVSPADGRVMEVVEESLERQAGPPHQRVSLDLRRARQPLAGGGTHHGHRVPHRKILRGHARPGFGGK